MLLKMAAAHVLAPPEAGPSVERLPPTLSFSLSRAETIASLESPASLTSLSGDTFDAQRLSSAQLHDTFLGAELFASVVLSRLRKEPLALDARLWALHEHENRLWALKQQALLGSCDTSRGSKAYLAALDPTGGDGDGRRLSWRPEALTTARGVRSKLWQNLGDLPHEQAKIWYIHIVTDICPEWRNPLRADSALLRAWTPDNESDQCALCIETFTFLNRRHHCRRCLRLVCAVCSPHVAPLRMFSQTAAPKRQRVCSVCFREMQDQVATDSAAAAATKAHARASESDDDDALLSLREGNAAPRRHSAALESAISADDPTATTGATGAVLTRTSSSLSSSSSSSGAIHCGTLEFFHGAGFRKSWHTCFFVLLIRKGSLGMFPSAREHADKAARPAAVFKLSGYAVRVKSQKRRPHQFRAAHATKKALHFAARSIEEMNAWLAQLLRAIEVANELEALAPLRSARAPRRGSLAGSVGSVGSAGSAESDFVGEDDGGEVRGAPGVFGDAAEEDAQ
ncbi:hypothetical protein PybrP1_000430 [[Pythium] brassicae (nom. inval.)]|nr:hypothetical protein PybrP1_000430 [[Pythium] brassicae (nom. inval.)]